MRKPPEFLQSEEEEEPHTELGVSLSQKKERVLRRATLEILPSLQEWAQRKSAVTQLTLRETLQRPSLYEQAPPSQWRGVIEEFCERDLELLILGKRLGTTDLIRIGQKKSPLIERLQEIENKETLLLIWHPDNGLLACTNAPLPKHFPKILTQVLFESKTLPPHTLWLWDRKNFSPHE